MKICIPFKDSKSYELKYTLRGIEQFIDNPEIFIIGDKPKFKNINHIPFKDHPLLRNKERNIFYKLLLMKDDFLFFNDDHYLLEPYKETYDYYGTLSDTASKLSNSFSHTLINTIKIFGDIRSYFRHNPMFIKRNSLESLTNLDWNKNWGYCVKSIYAALEAVEGNEYPDLKIRTSLSENEIKKLIEGRKYFSSGNSAMNNAMLKVLNDLYPVKSKYE